MDDYGAVIISLPVVPSNGNSFHGTDYPRLVYAFVCVCVYTLCVCESVCVLNLTCHLQA